MITITQIKKETIQVPGRFYKRKGKKSFIHILDGTDAAGFTECDELSFNYKNRWEIKRNATFVYLPESLTPITAEEYAEAYSLYLTQEVSAARRFDYVAMQAWTGLITLAPISELEADMAPKNKED